VLTSRLAAHYRLLLLLLVIVLTLAYSQRHLAPPATQEESATGDAQQWVHFAEEVVITTTANDGLPRYRLSSPQLQHHADGSSQLVTPHIELLHTAQRWQIRADLGERDRSTSTLSLLGKVTIVAEGQQLTTHDLTIDLNHDRATTAAAVTLTTPLSQLNGIGMTADLRQQQFTLHAQVHGYHVPISR
jgi:lipopolysaccharide export system protein LptC